MMRFKSFSDERKDLIEALRGLRDRWKREQCKPPEVHTKKSGCITYLAHALFAAVPV